MLHVISAGLQCPELADPENGVVTVTGTTVGATATYSCSDGFALVGAATRICQLSGFWSGAEPFCRGIYYLAGWTRVFGLVVLTSALYMQ